jgi:mono/diheme cytochrome c family protein
MTRWLAISAACLALSACTRSNMDSQPKYNEYKPGELFSNGQSRVAPPPGAVARDDLDYANEKAVKPPLTASLLARGREQLDIYCAPCHGRTGDGNGMVVQRGMPQPPSFHAERLRQAKDQHFFDVISNGHGVMYGYGDRVRPRDRWAIVAYVRALQLSQTASLNDIPPDQRAALEGTAQ